MTPLVTLRDWQENSDEAAMQRILLPLDTCTAHLPRLDIPAAKQRFIRNGNDIACANAGGEYALYADGTFIGVGLGKDDRIYPVRLCALPPIG